MQPVALPSPPRQAAITDERSALVIDLLVQPHSLVDGAFVRDHIPSRGRLDAIHLFAPDLSLVPSALIGPITQDTARLLRVYIRLLLRTVIENTVARANTVAEYIVGSTEAKLTIPNYLYTEMGGSAEIEHCVHRALSSATNLSGVTLSIRPQSTFGAGGNAPQVRQLPPWFSRLAPPDERAANHELPDIIRSYIPAAPPLSP